jgi:hypothetical protein
MSPDTFNQGTVDSSTNLCLGAIQYDPNYPQCKSKNELCDHPNPRSDYSIYRAKLTFHPGSLTLHSSKAIMWCLTLAGISSALLNLLVTISSPTFMLHWHVMPLCTVIAPTLVTYLIASLYPTEIIYLSLQ